MEKKKIKVEVFHEINYDNPIPYSSIKDVVQDDDLIYAGWEDAYYTENNGMDGHFYVRVERWREETDEEFEKRKKDAERDEKWAKERRYESYLKLKKEFEPDNTINKNV